MQLSEYMKKYTVEGHYGMLNLFPRIRCKDGFTISIQAGDHAYCSPRNNHGDWFKLEAGFPSCAPSHALLQYAEQSENPTDTVYPYVPIDVLQDELDLHGGIVGCAKDFE